MADLHKQMQDQADAHKKADDEMRGEAARRDRRQQDEIRASIPRVSVQQWQYRSELLSGLTAVSASARLDALNKGLESLGRESWELCAVVPWGNDTLFVFKKPHFE